MRETITKCDICMKKIDSGLSIEIPIRVHTDTGLRLDFRKFDDICMDCLNEIANTMSNKYYEMCNRNNYTGFVGIVVDSEEEGVE